MDQKLLAALRTLTPADFTAIYGNGMLAERLHARFVEAREANNLQLYLLSLTNEQQQELAAFLKVIINQQVAKVHGTFKQLHQMCTWLHQQGRAFFIEVLDFPQAANGADFAILVSQADLLAYENDHHHASAA